MTAQTILPANSVVDTGFATNSLRFNRGSTDFLNRTLGTPTNVDKATFSTWIKFSDVTSSNDTVIFAATADGNNTTHLEKLGGQTFRMNMREGSNYIGVLTTNRLFRDPSAWYHIVVAYDTTQGTGSNRVKLYINGVQETSFSTATYPTQNVDLRFNTSGQVFRIGHRGDTANSPDGYFAETVFIDGQQLAADQFGEFDSDSPSVWKPIDVSGLTFGDNGFYLQFKGSGTSANSSGMGADTSGNGNHLTVNNLTAIDQSTDTCTNNFATLNPLHRRLTSNAPTYSEGNLKLTGQTADGANNNAIATIQHLKSGKWYFEVKCTTDGDTFGVGISDNPKGADGNAASASNHVWYNIDGTINYGTSSSGNYGNSYTDADIIGVAFDLDNGAIYFYKNGTIQNSGTAARTDLLTTMVEGYTPIGFTNKGVMDFNFGSPSFAISSGNADENDHGNFEYAVPSGYFALNTKNLAEHG